MTKNKESKCKDCIYFGEEIGSLRRCGDTGATATPISIFECKSTFYTNKHFTLKDNLPCKAFKQRAPEPPPCPSCGSPTKVEEVEHWLSYETTYRVICKSMKGQDCYLTGPLKPTIKEAVEVWSKIKCEE